MNEPLVVATPASDLKTVYAQDFGKEPAPKKFSCRDPFFAALVRFVQASLNLIFKSVY